MAPPPPPGSAEKHKGKARRSEYVGVCWDKQGCKWAAYIKHDGKLKRKGAFHTEEEAARAFDDAARELRGGAAHGAKFKLNFPTVAEKQEAAAAAASAATRSGSRPYFVVARQPRFQPQALSAGTSLANSSREGRQGAGRGARSGFRQYCAGGSTRSATNRASRLPRGPRVEQLPKTAG
jgi:hypothetical protein